MNDVIKTLQSARTLYPRSMLALATTLYALFTIISPDVHYQARMVHNLLPAGYRLVAATLFTVDAIGLWWRIFDSKPRVVWGTLLNLLTAGLWLTVTVASIALYDESWSENVGEIILTLTALYILTRTDYTSADRGSA